MASGTLDLVIRDAAVHDGLGSPPRVMDVAVQGDRITAVGRTSGASHRELDAEGLALAPGFIDVHTHDDIAVRTSPDMDFKTLQGVTTEIVGNCGFGPAPGGIAREVFAGWHPDIGHVSPWEGYGDYLALLDREPPSVNVAVLVGHGTVRRAALGDLNRAPTRAELDRMRTLLAEGLRAGALGLSTGLVYEPGRFAEIEELVTLAGDVAEAGGRYVSHLRNEGEHLLTAVAEALRIGEQAGVGVQISHHKAAGEGNWGKVRSSLALIEAARRSGLDVAADWYPYTASSTNLAAVVSNCALDPERGSGGLGRIPPEAIRLASAPGHPDWEGRSLRDLAGMLGLPPVQAAPRVLSEAPAATVVIEAMCEADLGRVLRHPSTMIGSDGLPTGGRPHPRLYGTFPRVLGHYARDLGVLPLAEAVHRMTGLPAQTFNLVDRGVVADGAFADFVLFDPDTILDMATYEEPRRHPRGIHAVFVNGVQVAEGGTHTGARPGAALRRPTSP